MSYFKLNLKQRLSNDMGRWKLQIPAELIVLNDVNKPDTLVFFLLF